MTCNCPRARQAAILFFLMALGAQSQAQTSPCMNGQVLKFQALTQTPYCFGTPIKPSLNPSKPWIANPPAGNASSSLAGSMPNNISGAAPSDWNGQAISRSDETSGFLNDEQVFDYSLMFRLRVNFERLYGMSAQASWLEGMARSPLIRLPRFFDMWQSKADAVQAGYLASMGRKPNGIEHAFFSMPDGGRYDLSINDRFGWGSASATDTSFNPSDPKINARMYELAISHGNITPPKPVSDPATDVTSIGGQQVSCREETVWSYEGYCSDMDDKGVGMQSYRPIYKTCPAGPFSSPTVIYGPIQCLPFHSH